MTPVDSILVPTDFSGNSVIAAAQAGMLARHFHAQITLLHVDEFPVIHPFTTEAHRAEHMMTRRQELMQFAAAELDGVAVKRIVCCGDPANVICGRAFEEQPDLILVPARGNGAFRRFLLGSVTAKVLNDAACPVWTGAHLESPAWHESAGIRKVMCAVDFGPQSGKTIHWASEFARALGAKLTVVHAVLETPPNLPDRFAFQWHEESRAGASQRLHELLIDCETAADVLVVGDGDVPKSLARAAKANGADLLVVGRTVGERAAGRLGSQIYPIVCTAPCSVVSV
jgi:nucleotide-binding universal stress UspA family protein